jgi:hypothetical protein
MTMTPCKPSLPPFWKMDGSRFRQASQNDRRPACGSGGKLADESLMRFPAIIPEAECLPESSPDGRWREERDGAAFRRVDLMGAFLAWAITPATSIKGFKPPRKREILFQGT